MGKKKKKIQKARDPNAQNAQFRTSAGPMKSPKDYTRKKKHKNSDY